MPGPIQSAISGVMNTTLAGAVAGKHLKEQHQKTEDALKETVMSELETNIQKVFETSTKQAEAEVNAALEAAPGEDTQLGKDLEGLLLTYDEAVESQVESIAMKRLDDFYKSPFRKTQLAYAAGEISYEDAIKARKGLSEKYAATYNRIFGTRRNNNGSKND